MTKLSCPLPSSLAASRDPVLCPSQTEPTPSVWILEASPPLRVVSERGQGDRARDGNEEVAAREKSGHDSKRESDLGRLGRKLGRAGSDEGVSESRFLTGLSAR